MEAHRGDLDTSIPEATQEPFREMQSRSRSRDGPRITRVHGLIALPVRRLLVAIEVRWERDLAVLFERALQRALRLETDDAPAAGGPLLDHETQVGSDDQSPAWLQLRTGAHQSLPPISDASRRGIRVSGSFHRPQQQHLAPSAGGLSAQQSNWKDAALVDHDQIPLGDKRREVREAQVPKRGGRRAGALLPPREDEQAAAVTLLDRIARDPVRGEGVVVRRRKGEVGRRRCRHVRLHSLNSDA